MKFLEMRTELGWQIGFNEAQTNQDVTAARMKSIINRAYAREVRKAASEANPQWLTVVKSDTWPASTATRTFAQIGIDGKIVFAATDITSADPGECIVWSRSGLDDTIRVLDRDTLQWGQNGPGSARTLRWFLRAAPEVMLSDDDEPKLIPADFHYYLVHAAACLYEEVARRQVPRDWAIELNDMRMDFWKYVRTFMPVDGIDPVVNLIDEFGDY